MKGYLIYMLLMAVIAIPILITPVFLNKNLELSDQIQGYYSYFCHQLTSRSYCFFPATGSIEDCYSGSEFVYSQEWIVNKNGVTGYKMPVCARDLGFYLFAMVGGVFLFVIDRYKSIEVPNPLWLILALIPFALDGGSQFIGWRESTNMLRMITGSVAGFVLPFYLVPIFNRFIK